MIFLFLNVIKNTNFLFTFTRQLNQKVKEQKYKKASSWQPYNTKSFFERRRRLILAAEILLFIYYICLWKEIIYYRLLFVKVSLWFLNTIVINIINICNHIYFWKIYYEIEMLVTFAFHGIWNWKTPFFLSLWCTWKWKEFFILLIFPLSYYVFCGVGQELKYVNIL